MVVASSKELRGMNILKRQLGKGLTRYEDELDVRREKSTFLSWATRWNVILLKDT